MGIHARNLYAKISLKEENFGKKNFFFMNM